MQQIFNNLSKAFPLRLFLNIVLWLVVAWHHYHSNVPEKFVAEITVYKTISLLSLVLFTYLNNLVLIPRFLRERRFVVYFLFALLLITGYALLYTIFILQVVEYNPALKFYEIVLLSVP